VSRPWKRTLQEMRIVEGSTVSVIVKCEETPILGSDHLVNSEISSAATDLLHRRGFIVSEQNPDYILKIFYKTIRVDKESSIQINQSGNWLSSRKIASGYSGFGVMLANSLETLATSSASMSQVATYKYEVFNHQLSCEIFPNQEDPVWKHDTYVESSDVNILNHSRSLLQIAFAELPSSEIIVPTVPKVRKNKVSDFTNQFLVNRSFICPALPSYILFRIYDKDILGVSHPEALMAYMDLLQTAEYAIPNGSETDWEDPTQSRLWNKATLIGRYHIGSSKEPVNVVVNLSGTTSKYLVKECLLVSDEAFRAYQAKYDSWKQALQRYYQFFE
jgi:hypothetical protein